MVRTLKLIMCPPEPLCREAAAAVGEDEAAGAP